MKCYFSEPVEVAEADFEFSVVECDTTTPILELITNENFPEREFYIQKTFTYGEAIIVWFLTIFAVCFIAKTVFNFLWKK